VFRLTDRPAGLVPGTLPLQGEIALQDRWEWMPHDREPEVLGCALGTRIHPDERGVRPVYQQALLPSALRRPRSPPNQP